MALNASEVERILKDSAFDKLPRDKAREIVSLARSLEGKSGAESARVIMEFAQTLKGYDFSKEEQAAMQQAVLNSLSREDAKKFSALVRFMQLA